VRLFRFRGVDARIHLLTVIVYVGLLLSSLAYDNYGFWLMLFTVVAAFGLVLIHEFGHVFACRHVGGEANRIVMLPWGGLALTMPPPTWRANLITTLGGPAVHVPIFVLLAAALALVGDAGAIVFNPLNPSATLVDIASSSTATTYALWALWTLHYVNVLLFVFNMVLVFFPFDAGRIIQALLWKKNGYRWATTFAVHFGLAGAVLLFVIAIVFGNTFLVAIAAFGGISCWSERQRLQAVDEITGLAPGELDAELNYSSGLGGGPMLQPGQATDEPKDAGPSKSELKRLERERAHTAEIDRILAKISDEGMESLSKREKRLLADETKKKQSS
jgi:stage IV sporulation protein FB